MKTIKGVVELVDLGGGGLVLVGADGSRHQLVGEVPARLVGRQVSVKGRPVEAMGFLMTGDPSFEVVRIEAD